MRLMQFPYDDQLAGLVANDATSIDDVVRILQAVDALLDGTKDGLKWFNTLYLQVTLKVRGSGPTKFITDLDFKFADLYLTALRGWLTGGGLPESWRILFEQRANARLARIQFALAGVNAHINRDLAVAVVKTCSDSGLQVRHGTEEYREYTEINVILDTLIEQAKRELMVTLPGDALPGADKVEQLVGAWGVAAARETAWVHAEILAAIAGDAALAGRFVDGLDGTAALAGKALLLVMV
jgi:hypothetical protein